MNSPEGLKRRKAAVRNASIWLFCLVSNPQFGHAQDFATEVRQFIKVQAPIIALVHVRVMDGTGALPRENQTVILSGGKIAAIGGSSKVDIPAVAKVLDLSGCTVIPGLVGMHDHLFYPLARGNYGEMGYSFPRLYLAAGVTTIRTTGSIEPYTDLEIKRSIDAGKMPGPKMHVTGPYLEGEGAWALQMHQLAGPEDATRTVNYWLDEGADNFKVYNYITPAELSATIAAAHKRGAKVTGHLCSIGYREAALLGIDNLEHGIGEDSEFLTGKKLGECPDVPEGIQFNSRIKINEGPVQDMIQVLVQRHVAMTSTLPVFELAVPGRQVQQRVLDVLSPDARAAFVANKTKLNEAAFCKERFHAKCSIFAESFDKDKEFDYAFAKAGGLLLAGVDPTLIGGVVAGYGDQREVELLVESGFTPIEAIHIATENGAQYLGEADRIGTIERGKSADLVVIRGDVSKNIEDIENVEIVFKNGIGYDSAKLIDSVKGQVGLR